MASVNKVIVLGNLGKDPELRYTQQGTAVAKFTVATKEWGGNQGEDRTEWHRITVWGKQAENCNTYLSKGKQVYLEGRLQTSSWDDKDGNKRYTTEIIAQTVQFLGSRGDRPVEVPNQTDTFYQQQPSPSETSNQPLATPSDSLDDVPF